MLTPQDFIHLLYTPDLTQAGIQYACQSLPYTYNRMRISDPDRLRRIIAGVGVELAFRRWLSEQNIPFDTLGATPFTQPDRYDVAINGQRIDIKSAVFNHRKRIQSLRENPALLLGAHALIPVDQLLSEHYSDRDIYVFAFVNALFAPNRTDSEKLVAAGKPVYWMYALPEAWSHGGQWQSLGEIALKCDTTSAVQLELGGQGATRAFLGEAINLAPRCRTTAGQNFYRLAYVHTVNLPDGPVGLHSPTLKETLLIQPEQWSNVWVYGIEIYYTGYMTRREFRQKSQKLVAGSKVFQYDRTRTDNFALPVGQLRPLQLLFK